jgi:hypothetical protein
MRQPSAAHMTTFLINLAIVVGSVLFAEFLIKPRKP